jgi:mono/diheme cytochrome c family protein
VKLRVPLLVKLGGVVVATTAFYTYVGQMVPQKEVYPPQEVLIKADVSTAEMVTIGKTIFEGKGMCTTCHTIGKKTGPYRFPDLDNVDVNAKTREPGLSDLDYFAKALYEPDAFIVPGFNPGMPTINKPPIGLSDQEILCVMAFLQSQGGTPTVTLETKHAYNGGGAAKP